MSGNKDQTSTLQSVVDQASAAISSGIGSLTGNPADKREAETKRATADAEHDLSHTAAKAGPFTVNASGGVAKDDPDRSAGSWNQTVGSAKEALGGLVGAEGLRQEGIRQNEEGKGQEAQGQVKDLGKGLHDRVGGAIGGAVAGLTGNAAQQSEAQKQHDDGKARQRGVEVDLQKQARQEI
ncbi:uncharacterized protein CC84DRAFT_1083785 [Paraphaeosphaeria sporulosa]|uniref:CsbD-like domain-containing protein n=1 Tax=Paraphaeosphaeria sporulosa TaxID=1460663 RepID=A0A177CQ33_9PLEO|nr:uncharacterized protein CC84DRAFT_1083785 [Paraphaeosphaeria sporulosa]OAG09635.1 hypothetical protein CC84DRAFT_1083785 [Paraphaeosphaeria sporulosa]